MTTVARIESPYRGLASFGESELDGLLFFGRERETEITTANLLASRLTVLYGPSGVGKSSLLRAGVARRVRELGARRAVGRGPDLACVVFGSWSGDAVARLNDAIADAVAPLVSPTFLPPPDGARLADVAEHWSEVVDGDLCIVLDQLEEYFVYHDQERGADSLLGQLPELITRPGLRANVLLSVREDELARLGALKDRVPNVFANARRLDRLDRDSARAAILGPLERWNELDEGEPVEIEPELVDAVLDETAVAGRADRVEAPYLQLVMERVWETEAEAGSRLLRLSTLRDLGGAEAIVRAHLDRALGVLDPEQQDAAARMFEHLVTPSGTKIAHRASDLAAFARVDEREGHEVLESLGRERILRPVEDEPESGGRYEIFHDVLAQAILEWSRRRDVDNERRLAKRRQRRLLALAAAALAAVAVMIVVTAYALGQRSDAKAQALAANALAALVNDPQRGLQLADEAAHKRSIGATEQVLRTALLADRARAVLRGNRRGVRAVGLSHGHVVSIDGAGSLLTFGEHSGGPQSRHPLGGRVRAAAIAARGGALVVARRRLVEVRGLDPGASSFAFRAPGPVRAVAIDGRGDRVAVATIDGRLLVRDARRTLLHVHAPWKASSLALNDSGRVLAAAAGHRSQVWRLARGRVIARATDRSAVTGVAVSPDGTSLATASTDGAARLRSLPGGALTNVLVTGAPLTGVDFSRDGSEVVTRDRTGTSRTLSTADGHTDAVLTGHADAVTAAAFSANGAQLVTGSADNTLRVWDPGIAPELKPLASPPGCCSAFLVGADSAIAAAGNRALIYRAGRLVAQHSQRAQVTGVAFSGADAVTGGADGSVRVWSLPPLDLSAGKRVTALAASPSRIVAAAGRTIDVWSSSGTKLATFHERAAVDGLAISPDGRLLATAGVDSVARIRNLETGRLLHELRRHTKAVTGVAFSPDGRTLATSSVDHDARLWDTRTGDMTRLLREHFAKVAGVAFSPDGRWLVTAGPTAAGLWQIPTGTFEFLYGPSAQIVGAGFTADSRTVLTGSLDGTIRRYRCAICGTLPELRRLADRRLAATR